MKFQQVYYTSCEEGVRGGKGFQILAHGENMAQPLLRAIEQLAAYSPPRALPTRPTPEEIARFPVSLLYQRLKDGTPLVAQNRYVGRDYSGRFGNFFMHALVPETPDAGPLPVAPICLWGAAFWKHEGASGTTRSLPCHGIEEGSHPFETRGIARFLQEGKRLDWVSRFLGAVETALGTGRRIILVDSDTGVAGWVKLASSLLPDALCQALTFDTYARSPYERDVLLVGTSADSDFRFSPHELEYQFLVFDFEGQRSTRNLPETPFSRQVAEACRAGRFEEVAGFPEFVRRAGLKPVAGDLGDAYTYHAMQAGLPIHAPVPSAQVLRWCASHLPALRGARPGASPAGGAASPIDPLETACRELLAKCDDPKAAAEATFDLIRACQGPGLEDAAAPCRQALVPWMSEVVLHHEAVDWISSLLATGPSLAHDYPPKVQMDVRSKVEACVEPQRCATLLELLDSIGVLDKPFTKSRELGWSKIELLLADEGGRQLLRAKVASGTWREFFEGAVERAEQSLGGKEGLPADWRLLLADGGAREGIRAIASRLRLAALPAELGRLAVAQGGGDPVRELELSLGASPTSDPWELERRYHGLFRGNRLRPDQAARVAALLRRHRVTPAIYESLGDALLEAPELRTDDPHRHPIAADLQTISCTEEVPRVTAAASLVCLTAHIRRAPGQLRPAQIVELEKHLRWLPDSFVAPTVMIVADGLLDACHKQDARAHRACLEECMTTFGPPNFQPVFTYVLHKKIRQAKAASPVEQLVANLFAYWAQADPRRDGSSSTFVLDELLPGACRALDGGSWESVREHLVTISRGQRAGMGGLPLPTQWDEWARAHRPTFWRKLFRPGRKRR